MKDGAGFTGGIYVPRASKSSRRKGVLDPEAVDLTVDSLLTALAQHGARIEQLAPPETITVAVRFRADPAMLFNTPELWLSTSVTAAPQRVNIQVPVEAIQDHAAGKTDLQNVRE